SVAGENQRTRDSDAGERVRPDRKVGSGGEPLEVQAPGRVRGSRPNLLARSVDEGHEIEGGRTAVRPGQMKMQIARLAAFERTVDRTHPGLDAQTRDRFRRETGSLDRQGVRTGLQIRDREPSVGAGSRLGNRIAE